MTPVRVLTVDDQSVSLEAVRAVIESTPGFALAGEVRSGQDALAAVERLHPDLVLMDVRMPGLDGIETARRLRATGSDAVVALVSGHDLDDVRSLAEESGAVTIVAKQRLQPGLLRELWERHGRGRLRTNC